jgi:creatinine amidohydrolase
MQLEEYLTRDDRVVLPVGSTEQHAYLSIETDNIIAERLAVEAADGLGVPVLPVLAYGVTGFVAFPGSPTLAPETFASVVRDIVDSLCRQGFRRVLVANAHGGNTPEHSAIRTWIASHRDAELVWHDVWDGPPDALAAEIDADFDHASWSENFPWTRVPGVQIPSTRKPPVAPPRVDTPERWREALGDGLFGGLYQRPDAEALRVWEAAVEQLRERLENGWSRPGRGRAEPLVTDPAHRR